MTSLKEIWTRRANTLFERNRQLKEKQSGSSLSKSGFDFSRPLYGDSLYEYKNFMDLSIHDLRDVLTNLQYGELSEYLDKNAYEISEINRNWLQFQLTDKNVHSDIQIVATTILDQAYFVIHLPNYGAYSISWYKNRGGIDSIIDLEYGDYATLYDITQILVALGLEEDHSDEWEPTETFTVT